MREEGTYLFIDGEYLREAHDSAMRSVFGVPGELEVERIADHAKAFRTYYYDCEETQRDGESEADFLPRTKPQSDFLSEFSRSKECIFGSGL